jgi:hypothetical protein
MTYFLDKSFVNDLDGVYFLCLGVKCSIYFSQSPFTHLTEKLKILDVFELSWSNIGGGHAFIGRWNNFEARRLPAG